jgi:hypothetical protein
MTSPIGAIMAVPFAQNSMDPAHVRRSLFMI